MRIMMAQNFAKPQGILIFNSLADAVRNGFQPYERTGDGYLVRRHTVAGLALAIAREVRS